MNNIQTTKSVVETYAVAKDLVYQLNGGDILTLSGELGAGKTTFVQGLSQALGIKRRIISPTFMIVRSYEVPENDKQVERFYHIDLYRTTEPADLESVGLSEILQDKHAIVAIEWPERLGKLLPKTRWEISLRQKDDTIRTIRIRYLLS